jgi:hypothetical protein
MTLNTWFATYQGKSLLVPGEPVSETGQCVQAADIALNLVYGLPYHYGNAIDWWNYPGELVNNFNLINDGTIQKGDFVVYGTGVGSPFGHIDIALQNGSKSSYIGADSNWNKNLTVHTVNHNDQYNQYILGVLRNKSNNGGNMPDNSIPTSTQIGEEFQALAGRQPTQDELNLFVGLNWFDGLKQYLFPGVQTLRDTITNLENDRDTHLYPFINKVTAILGLPTSATADECVAAISKLKGSPTKLAPGIYEV